MMQFYLQTRPSRERVLHYYSALRSSGVPPSAHTYKLLLDTYHTLPPLDLTAMERTFAELCADRSTKVQGTHWASLITAYGISAADVPKAIEVFDLIASHPANRGTNPLAEPVVWEAILNVLGTRGTVEQMEEMRARMAQSEVRPTAYVYNVLISGYARHGQIEVARSLFESMADTSSGHSAPNNHPSPYSSTQTNTDGWVYREPSTYESMIKAELNAGDQDRAEGILRRMEERRYPVAVYMKARALVEGGGVGHGGMMGGYTPLQEVRADVGVQA
jgi:pentatricopeptide repeat protein